MGQQCHRYKVSMFLLIVVIVNIRCAIIPTSTVAERKCYGNFVLIGTRCTPCKIDQIAQKNQCVKMVQPQYGTNIKNVSMPSNNPNSSNATPPPPSTNVSIDPKCVQANNTNPTFCIKCVGNYDLVVGKCVQKSCKIYAQLLNKCIDNPTQADLLFLSVQNPPKSNNTTNSSQEGYIVGVTEQKMNILLADTSIALNLSGFTLSLKLDLTELQQTEIYTEIYTPTNFTNNANNAKTSSIQNCVSLNKQLCEQCAAGYLLNSLLNQCVTVNFLNIKFRTTTSQ